MISLAKANAISTEKIATLRPEFARKVLAWLAECTRAGLKIYIYEGFRSCARQKELFAIGRTVKGTKVTNAGPGESMHQYGEAIDFVTLKPAPKAADMFEADWDNEKAYAQAHAIAAKHGLRKISWETPHLENARLANWQAARKKYGNPCTA